MSQTGIPAVPIARPHLGAEEERAVIDVLRSGWVSMGPRCADFERVVSDYVGVSHGRAVNSGTSAIHLALLANDVKAGDEVIIPAATCAAAVHPVEAVGAKPVPVDIKLGNFGIDPAHLRGAVTSRTKAIFVAHLFGLAADIEPIAAIARERNLKLLEDSALGLGARVGERHVGTYGDAATLSFHPRKTITTGEGGMVLTNSDEVARRVAALRSYGASVQAWERHNRDLFELPAYDVVGFNYKMTDIQATIGLQQAVRLPEIVDGFRRVARRYHEALRDLPFLTLPVEPPGHRHSYQSYVCLCVAPHGGNSEELRRRLFRHLSDRKIAAVQGIQSVAEFAYYGKRYGWKPSDFPVATLVASTAVALPIFPDLTDEQQNRVIEALHEFSVTAA